MDFNQTKALQFNLEDTSTSRKKKEKQVYELLHMKEYMVAYSIAKSLEHSPSIALYINLALCLKRIGEVEEAVLYLEKAFRMNHAALDLSNSQFTIRELQLLRAEDEDKFYFNPIHPEVEYSLILIDFRIELLLLDLHRKSKNIERMKNIIHKYQRYELRSIEEAIDFIKRM